MEYWEQWNPDALGQTLNKPVVSSAGIFLLTLPTEGTRFSTTDSSSAKEISSVRKVQSGRDQVPVRNIRIEEDGFQIRVALWREASVEEICVAEMVSVSHLKVEPSAYGRQLKSTTFTKVEKHQGTELKLDIMGVMDCASSPDTLELLSDQGDFFFISKEQWEPFQALINKGPVTVEVTVNGKHVKDIKGPNSV
ncbi:hypothetical protein OJAV_G00236850 [Oryzias javanicus]|uniref:Uncharacterized protein n=1 Tax=Oryzias javanicus TaxID=123683 RepID=A0A3S2P2F0_ORYJA|nr:hypothetical protein OJAV_G00236850 [Oryzias javanicus]